MTVVVRIDHVLLDATRDAPVRYHRIVGCLNGQAVEFEYQQRGKAFTIGDKAVAQKLFPFSGLRAQIVQVVEARQRDENVLPIALFDKQPLEVTRMAARHLKEDLSQFVQDAVQQLALRFPDPETTYSLLCYYDAYQQLRWVLTIHTKDPELIPRFGEFHDTWWLVNMHWQPKLIISSEAL